jgi:hypothetical protein
MGNGENPEAGPHLFGKFRNLRIVTCLIQIILGSGLPDTTISSLFKKIYIIN